MGRMTVLLMALLLLIATEIWAEPAAHREESSEEASGVAPAMVQAAPGGGEMVVLGPESRYVIRARPGKDRGAEIGCARKEASIGAEKVTK